MSEVTAIEWTDHTWSPVWGCTQVSPACDHCYAMTLANRFGHGWNGAPMREFGDHHWNEPRRWNRRAAAAGTSPKVFPSMCDPFDKDWPDGVRHRFLRLVFETPSLTWLLLTKRIGNWRKSIEEARVAAVNASPTDKELFRWLDDWIDGSSPANVWVGSTVINQEEADRDIPKLLSVPARVRFLSIEPMLGPIDLSGWLWGRARSCAECPKDEDCWCGWEPRAALPGEQALHWVIAGGESGPHARPTNPQWFRDLRDQCAAAGVPYLFKQWGEWTSVSQVAGPGSHHHFEDGRTVRRVGKKAAGRLLDGVSHDGYPDHRTLVISAMTSKDVKDFFEKHGGAISKALKP